MIRRLSWRRAGRDLALCVVFFTRLPMPGSLRLGGLRLADALWAAPLIGLLIGLIAAATYMLANWFGFGPNIATALTLVVTLAVTGCLHEDGLADLADGLGGGRDRAAKLAIMRDSRIGSFGAAALTASILLRWVVLSSLAAPGVAAAAMVAAQVGGRTVIVPFMRLVPPAREDGLAAATGGPPADTTLIATVIGAALLILCLGPARGLLALVLLALGGLAMAYLCKRQIGGQTGDAIGALEQVGEVLVLMAAAAALQLP